MLKVPIPRGLTHVAYMLVLVVSRGPPIFLHGPLHRAVQDPPDMASLKAEIQENEVEDTKPF